MLVSMFENGIEEIKTKGTKDIIQNFYSAEMQKIFYNNYALLGGIFHKYSTPNSNLSLKLTKTEFVAILRDADIVKPIPEVAPPKKDEKILSNSAVVEEIPEPKFYEKDAMFILS